MIGGRRLWGTAIAAITALVITGCGGGPPASGPPEPDVDIEEPEDNATVTSPVTVKMSAEAFVLEPAGEVREGAGHFHIMIDTPCVTPGQVIPADDSHKHYGKAQTEAVLELAPGPHSLCLQAGDGAHKALPLTDMMTITVE